MVAKAKREVIWATEDFNLEGTTPALELIKRIQDHLAKVPEEFRANANVLAECSGHSNYDEGCDCSMSFQFQWWRPETDAEVMARYEKLLAAEQKRFEAAKIAAKKRKENEERRAREQYEILRKRFEPAIQAKAS